MAPAPPYTACNNCHAGHTFCDKERPECGRCRASGKPNCTYPLQKKDSASPAASSAHQVKSSSISTPQVDVSKTIQPRRETMPAEKPAPGSVGTPSASNGKRARSPDSTIESTANNDRAKRPAHGCFDAEREARTPMLLFGHAAKQRQMEEVNFDEGKLDFDGLDPHLGQRLLDMHWKRQHHTYLVVYRPAFTRDMACAGPYFSKTLLNAIYFGAASLAGEFRKDPYDPHTAGWDFRERACELVKDTMEESDITTIQALLLMTDSMFAMGDKKSIKTAWLYAGYAVHMIKTLGLQLDIAKRPNGMNLKEEDLEIRRRVFWSAFVIDKLHSMYQGQAPLLPHSQCDVPILFQDDYEELERWIPMTHEISRCPGYRTRSVSTFTHLCKLAVILNEILERFYNPKGAEHEAEASDRAVTSIDKQLADWARQLPEHLKGREPDWILPSHVMSLGLLSHVARLLLHRPFTRRDHFLPAAWTKGVSRDRCCDFAKKIDDYHKWTYKSLDKIRLPFLNTYALYAAAITTPALPPDEFTMTQRAIERYNSCAALLRQQSTINPAARKARDIVDRLERFLTTAGPRGTCTHRAGPAYGDALLDAVEGSSAGQASEENITVARPQRHISLTDASASGHLDRAVEEMQDLDLRIVGLSDPDYNPDF
ncbi:unnamed protein product [Zymoseptoria tritici ST99CH_1A5]|uniref:Zn(2)-C6 fungal-type domain-containing protein n=1 Tax=Zymoseptoria tritici ST99CH_1A5 TaxID=1276529 RepID=A0A1Y6LW57_ZYMTR|nr:unnamed protein product [Zymoseptoria tritici ST99CH_1A5]